MKGWDYALANPDEAAQIIVDNDESGAQTLDHQKYMMAEVAKLVGGDAALDPAAYERTAKMVLDQKIITKAPEGAYTTAITDKL